MIRRCCAARSFYGAWFPPSRGKNDCFFTDLNLPNSHSSLSNIFLSLHRQLKPTRNLSLENSPWIIRFRRRPQTRHILPSISQYRILGLIRIVQVFELMQHPHISGRFLRFLHDCLSRLLDESVGGCGGPECAEQKNCKNGLSASSFYIWDYRLRSRSVDLPLTNAIAVSRRCAERVAAFYWAKFRD